MAEKITAFLFLFFLFLWIGEKLEIFQLLKEIKN